MTFILHEIAKGFSVQKTVPEQQPEWAWVWDTEARRWGFISEIYKLDFAFLF